MGFNSGLKGLMLSLEGSCHGSCTSALEHALETAVRRWPPPCSVTALECRGKIPVFLAAEICAKYKRAVVCTFDPKKTPVQKLRLLRSTEMAVKQTESR